MPRSWRCCCCSPPPPPPPPPPRPSPKSHAAAAALVPPRSSAAWAFAQGWRVKLEDAGLYRWPPHVNLLYPFVEGDGRDGALAEALAGVPPIDARLSHPAVFHHGRSGRATLYLAVAPLDRLQDLQRRLQAAVPHCDEQTANHGGVFTPHLTLAHFDDGADADAACARVAGAMAHGGVPWRVDRVLVMSRAGADGQFGWRTALRFGGAGASPDDDAGFAFAEHAGGVHVARNAARPPPPLAGMPTKEALLADHGIDVDAALRRQKRERRRRRRPARRASDA